MFNIKPARQIELQHAIIVFFMGTFLLFVDFNHINIIDKFNILYGLGAVATTAALKIWAALFIIVSFVRFAALIINGKSPVGSPLFRIIAAILTATLLTVFVVGTMHYPITLEIVYIVMIGFELFIVWNATKDMKYAYNTVTS